MKQVKALYIDPSYRAFDSDGLFDLTDPVLNRDNQLMPFNRLREKMASNDVVVHTADYLFKEHTSASHSVEYYSLGLLDRFEQVSADKRARLVAFVIMEPPVVLPALYDALPKITAAFERVYLPNTTGDGYSLKGVDVSKLHRLYWPIPHDHVLEPYWSNTQRMKRVVVINGSHNPLSKKREQYSLRIKAMAELSKMGVVDLYGQGWDKWRSRRTMWLPYWRNRGAIMSIYNGSCKSKYEVLQNYEFCLCFENMAMDGYLTEKLFDCLYAGTIPLYLGAPNVLDDIPKEVFIDCRKYSSWTEMWREVSRMSPTELTKMREAGRDFLQSEMAKKFYHSMENICENQ